MQDRNFSVQKNKIPLTAVSCDHAGEQENKILTINRELKAPLTAIHMK